MKKTLRTLFGLKFNPFGQDLPIEALVVTPRNEDFCWRIENGLVQEGGFALIAGDPGTGKSVALRILNERIEGGRDVTVRVITAPQSGISDFYRELGAAFGVSLDPRNRWGGFRGLRERWKAHIESTLCRPILLVDEAQAMGAEVLTELRLLSSAQFDSRNLLGVVLCGDARLLHKLQREQLLPLGSRLRARLLLERATKDELVDCLKHLIKTAGAPSLLTDELMDTLAEHACGNYRAMVIQAGDLLAGAARRDIERLDQALFLEMCVSPRETPTPKPRARSKRRR